MTTPAAEAAYQHGFDAGSKWIGPNGNGSFGTLSFVFIAEQAETFACGRPFYELLDGPTEQEDGTAIAYQKGFYDALAEKESSHA